MLFENSMSGTKYLPRNAKTSTPPNHPRTQVAPSSLETPRLQNISAVSSNDRFRYLQCRTPVHSSSRTSVPSKSSLPFSGQPTPNSVLMALSNDEFDPPVARTVFDKGVWRPIKARLEAQLRLLLIRFPKPTEAQVLQIALNVLGEQSEEDVYQRRALKKLQGNISGWQYDTIEAMIAVVDRIYVGEPLFSHVQGKAIYDHFEKAYSVKDVEEVFGFFSRMYDVDYGHKTPAARWLKDFYCNLAVMCKMHKDAPFSETTNRKVLCKFFQHFGQIKQTKTSEDLSEEIETWISDPDYARVKLSSFRKRRVRKTRQDRRPVVIREAFGKSQVPADEDSADETE